MDQLLNLLRTSTVQHREALRKLIDDPTYCKTSAPEDIIRGMRWLNRSLTEDFRRDVFHDPESYHYILSTVCERQKITTGRSSEVELEESIVRNVLQKLWDRLTPEQKTQMNLVMAEIASSTDASTSFKDIATIPVLLAAGNLGGFATYLAASTTLAAVGNALGITFPFMAYTTMSSAISVALGPVGWIVGGLYIVNKLAGPNDKKLLPTIVYIAGMRSEASLKRGGSHAVGAISLPGKDVNL